MIHPTQKCLKVGLGILMIGLMTLLTVVPVEAATTYEATVHDQSLPPLPEWPIIGPVLRFLGITKEKPEPVSAEPTPDPNLPEYRIETAGDLEQLQDIEDGQRVRINATEEALNAIVKETLKANTSDQASLVMTINDGTVDLAIEADTDFIKETGQNIPGLNADTVSIDATLDVDANQCVPFINITSMDVNNWGFGLRSVAQRTLNTQISEVWPDNLCLEAVFLTPGQVSIEGYRRP
jgi:hypothetical protein